MLFRIILPLLLVGGLATGLSAQKATTNCATKVKQHLAKLDKHLDLDYAQMKCLKEKAATFCERMAANPTKDREELQKRRAAYRKAILSCLDEAQSKRVRTHFKKKRGADKDTDLLDEILDDGPRPAPRKRTRQ